MWRWNVVHAGARRPPPAPRVTRRAAAPLEQGRLYTTWLYGSQYQKLWDRFSPEMRQTFGSVGELASFAGRAVTPAWSGAACVDERVDDASPFRVYSAPRRSTPPAVRCCIEWSLARTAQVTGLVVRPVPDDGR